MAELPFDSTVQGRCRACGTPGPVGAECTNPRCVQSDEDRRIVPIPPPLHQSGQIPVAVFRRSREASPRRGFELDDSEDDEQPTVVALSPYAAAQQPVEAPPDPRTLVITSRTRPPAAPPVEPDEEEEGLDRTILSARQRHATMDDAFSPQKPPWEEARGDEDAYAGLDPLKTLISPVLGGGDSDRDRTRLGGEGAPDAFASLRETAHNEVEGDPDREELFETTRSGHEIEQWVPGYRILRPIGEGASSQVFLVVPEGQGDDATPMAAKILKTTLDADRDRKSLRSFTHEVKALSQLNHPNVIAYEGCGQDIIGRPFLIMEYFEGGHDLEAELAQALSERRGLPLARVEPILMQVLDALEAAHQRNMVHRDIKPGNIMIRDVPSGGLEVKVLDFGLAKFTDEGDGTKTRHFAGTPMYMAPEQARGEGIRGWTDLYAVALIALEMITGRSLFQGMEKKQTLLLKMERGGTMEASIRGEVEGLGFPEEVIAFFTQALSKEPTERPGEASQFRGALAATLALLKRGSREGRFGEGLPPWQPQAGAHRRLASAKAGGRRWLLYALAGVVVLALGAAAGRVALQSGGGGDAPVAAVADGAAGGPVAVEDQVRPVIQVQPAQAQPEARGGGGEPGGALTSGGQPVEPGAPFVRWTSPPEAVSMDALLVDEWFSLPMFHGPSKDDRFQREAGNGLQYTGKGAKIDVHEKCLRSCVVLSTQGAFAQVECAMRAPPERWPAGPWAIRGWTLSKAILPQHLP